MRKVYIAVFIGILASLGIVYSVFAQDFKIQWINNDTIETSWTFDTSYACFYRRPENDTSEGTLLGCVAGVKSFVFTEGEDQNYRFKPRDQIGMSYIQNGTAYRTFWKDMPLRETRLPIIAK